VNRECEEKRIAKGSGMTHPKSRRLHPREIRECVRKRRCDGSLEWDGKPSLNAFAKDFQRTARTEENTPVKTTIHSAVTREGRNSFMAPSAES
jgi:hypothetical protein